MTLDLEKHRFIVSTEERIRQHESFIPAPVPKRTEWTMWCDLNETNGHLDSDLQFVAVSQESHWQAMFDLRRQVEKAYGLTDQAILEQIIADIKCKTDALAGCWYLVKLADQFIGEIGLIPFTYQGQKVGRLQDVDIVPSYQGKGYGRQLLRHLMSVAREQQYEALCLMALANDWPKDWYQKLGFNKVGET